MPFTPLRCESSTPSRRLLAVLAAVIGTVFSLAPFAVSPVAAEEIRPITLPIDPAHVGDVSWSDSFGAPRSGGRSHLGVDMMGPKMTPLVAAADGVVSWYRYSALAGNNLVITDDDGWQYHYVHINNDTPGTDDGANLLEFAFAPGIEQGVRVQAGQVVAYMGDSGNAEWSGSHLHFEIERPDGSNINPTPSVDAALANLQAGITLSPSQAQFIGDVFTVLVGETPSNAETVQVLDTIQAEGLAAAVAPFVDADSRAASIDRLYYAIFGRVPDAGGFEFWVEASGDGMGIATISNHFAFSEEYQARFGADRSEALLTQLYAELFDRAPDAGGFEFWMDALANNPDVTPGTVLAFFTEGAEAKAVAGSRSEIVALSALFNDGAMPTPAETSAWIELRRTVGLEQAITETFLGQPQVQALYGELLAS